MLILLTACQSTKPHSSGEAMGWQLTPLTLNDLPYAEVSVTQGAYAEQQGFVTGDLILLESFQPGVSTVNGVLETPDADAYLKSFVMEVCAGNVHMGRDGNLEVLRNGEKITVEVKDIPEMECA